MTKTTLEDKVKDANTAFGNEYCPKVEELGYYLMHGISKVGMRDSNAPKKDKNKPCLIAYLTSHESNPIVKPDVLVDIAWNIIPHEYKGFRVFLEYRKPLRVRNEPRPVPAYGVPHPLEEDIEKWERRND